jgi:hypothetical protein
MTQYLVAIHLPDDFDPSVEDEAISRDIDVLNEEMVAAGVRVFVGGLLPVSSAKSLRAQPGGKVLITDGPYLETKEHIGGFWVLEVATLDDALVWGRKAVLLAPTERRRTMKYLCLGYIEPGTFERMTEDERHAVFDECLEYNDRLRANGQVAAEVPLQPQETAVTLYWKNGKVATTDGPYAETREQLAGLLILEARDLNHAIQLISQHPGMKLGTNEIRPVADLSEIIKESERRRKDTSR